MKLAQFLEARNQLTYVASLFTAFNTMGGQASLMAKDKGTISAEKFNLVAEKHSPIKQIVDSIADNNLTEKCNNKCHSKSHQKGGGSIGGGGVGGGGGYSKSHSKESTCKALFSIEKRC